MQKIMAASSVVPGSSYDKVMSHISQGLEDPVLGKISHEHIQLCPQHPGKITQAIVESLMASYPQTNFRIHATPRVEGKHSHAIAEAVNAHEYPEQMKATANLSKTAGANGYTLHAGRREYGSLEQAFENTKRLADLFQCRVGIEGLYPSVGPYNRWLLATWEEHEMLLESGVDFAIDLSHLNIVAKRQKTQRLDLVKDLLSSPHCIECHLSDNDARADIHQPLKAASPPWWLPMLAHVHPETVIFYEGILIDPRKKREMLS
jgi:hypothetical protein